ncbi:MAG: cytochrome c oxidase subunit 3 [Planctomycetaceae bacterium]
MSHAPSHSVPPIKMGLAIPNSKLCMWLFLGTEIMFFTAFIGSYIVLRLGSKGWPTSPDVTHIRVAAGGINTFVLILSSYFVVVAHEAMREHNFAKARTFLQWTFALAFVFLGIKGFEYYGKISHDILPGHVMENDQQAKNKVLKESERAIDDRLHHLVALAVSSKAVDKLPEPKGDMAKLRAMLGGVADKAEGKAGEEFRSFGKMYEQFAVMKQAILSERTSLHEVEEQLKELKAAPLESFIKALQSIEESGQVGSLGNTLTQESEGLKSIDSKKAKAIAKAIETDLTALQQTSNPAEAKALAHKISEKVSEWGHDWGFVFNSVHDPHPILYGNIFASCYFLMTGFHALHVIIGMLLFGIVLMQPTMEGWHDFVENSGLYWHFVDLVWIFLFPLLYIV